MDKLGHVLAQYGALTLVVLACWGAGDMLLRGLKIDRDPRTRLGAPLAIALGLGIGICALQWLAIAGRLTSTFVTALLAVGLIPGLRLAIGRGAMLRQGGLLDRWRATPMSERWAAAALALALLCTLMAPLPPPMAWDELLYHLPHAQQWAASGHLTVNAWLRYPWFPYNFDLLYAAALLFGNDVLPHLLHALAGWLTAGLVYRLGRQHLDRLTACLAAALWVLLTLSEFTRAYVELGVALFVLVAAAAYQQWRLSEDRRWLLPCAFAIGLAIGSKYQLLTLLPLFALGLARHDRRPSTWLLVLGGLLAPCIYWYARNALLTGDPFNPVGGRLFGFTDWNAVDYRGQFEDLRRNHGLPAWPLWPALVVPFIPALRGSAAVRRALILSAYMVLVWVASAPYPRYLTPAYPLLALLSAAACVHLVRRAAALWPALHQRHLVRATAGLALACLAVLAAADGVRYWKRIAPTPAAREALLTARVTGYALWSQLRAHPVGRIYQIGVEDSLYYAPQPVWGDVFGPWRYSDYTALDAAQLHRKLAAEHFDALVVHTGRFPQVAAQPGFDRYFESAGTDGPVKLYQLKPRGTP